MAEFRLFGPDGAKPKGLSIDEFPDIVRLSIFSSDLKATTELLGWATASERSFTERDAFCLTALIKLLGCFESTAGARRKPLKPKKVFSPNDRERLENLRQFRNKIAVHDEQLYPMNSVIAAVMPDATIVNVYAIKATAPLHQIGQLLEELADLCAKVNEHVSRELDSELQNAADELNCRDLAWRQALLSEPDYSTRIETEAPEDARWKRQGKEVNPPTA